MLIYISHSASDSRLYKLLRDQFEKKGFTVISREGPFEFGEVLSEKGKRRIELADVIVMLLTSSGRSSYRVFQETEFIHSIHKNHFVIEGTGRKAEVKKNFYESNLAPESDRNYYSTISALEKLLWEFALKANPEAFNFIYHTDMVY